MAIVQSPQESIQEGKWEGSLEQFFAHLPPTEKIIQRPNPFRVWDIAPADKCRAGEKKSKDVTTFALFSKDLDCRGVSLDILAQPASKPQQPSP
jgi:hypothetical protein